MKRCTATRDRLPVSPTAHAVIASNGRKAAEEEFGDKVTTTFVEKVPEAADAERVCRPPARRPRIPAAPVSVRAMLIRRPLPG